MNQQLIGSTVETRQKNRPFVSENYFPHDHPVEFFVRGNAEGGISPDWKYNNDINNLMYPEVNVGQPSLNAIAGRIAGENVDQRLIRVTRIELYNQPGLFDNVDGQWVYMGSD